jgi:hypothetical protein
MPCHHIFQSYLLDYIENAKLADADREAPLFRTAYRRSGTLQRCRSVFLQAVGWMFGLPAGDSME